MANEHGQQPDLALQEWAQVLANQPSQQQTLSILADLGSKCDLNAPNSRLLAIFSALVSKTVIEYDGSNVDFSPVFKSGVGLSCLVSRISVLANEKNTPEISRQLEFLTSLLESVLSEKSLVAALYGDSTPLQAKQEINLFAGSRLLTVVAGISQDKWFSNGREYSVWLAKQLLEFSEIPSDFLDKTFKLGYSQDVSNVFLHRDTLPKFKAAFSTLRPAQQQFILAKGILPALETFSIGTIAAILKYLQSRINLVNLAAEFGVNIQRAVVAAAPLTDVTPLLVQWGDVGTIQRMPLAYQHAETQMLLSFAARMSEAQAKDITSSEAFVIAVSNRLGAPTDRARKMGTVVGEALGLRSGSKLKFGVSQEEDWILSVDEPSSLEAALAELGNGPVVTESIPSGLESVMQVDDSDNEVDTTAAAFDSDDEDDVQVAPPVYIKDLVEYLRDDSYEKQHSALTYGTSLILRKANFGSEVSMYAPELLKIAAGLGDKYNIDHFAQLRQDMLTAIVVADPSQGPTVSSLAMTGDYSLYQRMSLMTTLVLAARQLVNYSATEPVSKVLPVAQHSAFISDVDVLSREVQNKLVVETRDKHAEQLGPQVLRVSKKLTTAREASGPQTVNKYSKITAKYFFFPLAAQRIRQVGAYTPVLHAHMIKTLSLLVYYAYPTNDMGDMVGEMLDIIHGQRSQEPVVLESIYSALLILADVAGGLLVRQFPQKLGPLYDWAEQSWQTIPDDRTQKLGAGVVLRLGELMEQVQRHFTAFA